jgi:hypothetical protein
MNTLSVSKQSSGIGLRSSLETLGQQFLLAHQSGAHSVQPVAISVNTSVWMKLPLRVAHRASLIYFKEAGNRSCHSVKVRTGTLRRMADDDTVRRRGRPPTITDGSEQRAVVARRADRRQPSPHLRD